MSRPNIIVLDCHDSFVYNLVGILRDTFSDLCSYTIIPIEESGDRLPEIAHSTHLLLSPGPGHPAEMHGLLRLLSAVQYTHTIFGVCLGMQALALAFGAQLFSLPVPLHGHVSPLHFPSPDSSLFRDFPEEATVGRYHSWAVEPHSLPPELIVDATYADTGEIAALHHASLPISGVQFHPESILTQGGEQWLIQGLRL